MHVTSCQCLLLHNIFHIYTVKKLNVSVLNSSLMMELGLNLLLGIGKNKEIFDGS